MLARIPPWAVDVLLTVLVVVGTAGNRFSHGQHVLADTLALAASATVLLRRRFPRAILTVVNAANLAFATAHRPALTPAIAAMLLTVAEREPRRVGIRAAAVTLVAFAVATAIAHRGIAAAIPALIAIAALYAIGDSVRVRRESRAKESERAVADERARIARELHDMVTHNVSVMVVQAAAGNAVFDERPDQARAALAAVEETGRRALGELRRLLDVVTGDESADYDPQPGLDRLDTLVASVRATGLGVDLTVEGTPRELPPALELSAFRIVQECLTNTLKHARATHASVRVRYGGDELEVEVADDGVGALSTHGGRGLVGMRERVALFGGELAAGARPGGGFAVRARMPLEQA